MKHPNDPRDWLDLAMFLRWTGIIALFAGGLPEEFANAPAKGMVIFGLISWSMGFLIQFELFR